MADPGRRLACAFIAIDVGEIEKGAPMTAPEIQLQIERTRERLGETVGELASRADVRARARDKAAEVRAKAQDKATELSGRVRRSQVVPRRWPLAVAAGVVVIGTVAVCRRRRG
jgi:Protein of unknown function (DUF3618)